MRGRFFFGTILVLAAAIVIVYFLLIPSEEVIRAEAPVYHVGDEWIYRLVRENVRVSHKVSSER